MLEGAQNKQEGLRDRQVYTADKVRRLLRDLHEECFEVLLFLKSIQRLEILEWDAADDSPRCLYSCRVQVPRSSPLPVYSP